MKHTKYWPYLKWSAIVFWSLLLLVVVIMNTGCSFVDELLPEKEPEPQVIKEVINEEKINEKECKPIIKKEIIREPCNVTCPKTDNISYDRFELIRRLKYLENQQDKYFNDSECNWELNRTENKLEDCKDELCNEWNSSWC